jgi:hypothetical protein
MRTTGTTIGLELIAGLLAGQAPLPDVEGGA